MIVFAEKLKKRKNMKIKPFKIKVNPKQSEIVQKILFENGYGWVNGCINISCVEFEYLFFDEILTHNYSAKHYFFNTDLPELTFNEFMRLYSSEDVAKEAKVDNNTKVCIKSDGTDECGKKIIDYLKGLGGINKLGVCGYGNDGLYYYIVDRGYISYGKNIPEGYTEISLKELQSKEAKVDNNTKVCIKADGTNEYGKRIIDYLEGLGGVNENNYVARNYLNYYYIASNRNISCDNNIPEGYTEISLNDLPSIEPIVHQEISNSKLSSEAVDTISSAIDFPIIKSKIIRL